MTITLVHRMKITWEGYLISYLMIHSKSNFVDTFNTDVVLNRLVQFNVIRRYVKTISVYTTHRLNALAAPPGIRV